MIRVNVFRRVVCSRSVAFGMFVNDGCKSSVPLSSADSQYPCFGTLGLLILFNHLFFTFQLHPFYFNLFIFNFQSLYNLKGDIKEVTFTEGIEADLLVIERLQQKDIVRLTKAADFELLEISIVQDDHFVLDLVELFVLLQHRDRLLRHLLLNVLFF